MYFKECLLNLPIFLLFYCSVFLMFPVSFCHFLCLKNSYFRVDLLVTVRWKMFLLDTGFWVDLFLQHLKKLRHFFLASVVSFKKSIIIQTVSPLYKVKHHFSYCFFVFGFRSLSGTNMNLLKFIMSRFHNASWICKFYLPNLGNIQSVFVKYTFSHTVFFFFLGVFG